MCSAGYIYIYTFKVDSIAGAEHFFLDSDVSLTQALTLWYTSGRYGIA